MKNGGIIFTLLLLWCFNTTGFTQTTLTGKWTFICYQDVITRLKSCRPSELTIDQLTFTFKDNGHEGKVGGKTRINSVSGEYTIENTQITFKRFGGTYIAEIGWGCMFYKEIYQVTSFEIKSDFLTLIDYTGTMKMIFIRTEKFDQWDN